MIHFKQLSYISAFLRMYFQYIYKDIPLCEIVFGLGETQLKHISKRFTKHLHFHVAWIFRNIFKILILDILTSNIFQHLLNCTKSISAKCFDASIDKRFKSLRCIFKRILLEFMIKMCYKPISILITQGIPEIMV